MLLARRRRADSADFVAFVLRFSFQPLRVENNDPTRLSCRRAGTALDSDLDPHLASLFEPCINFEPGAPQAARYTHHPSKGDHKAHANLIHHI